MLSNQAFNPPILSHGEMLMIVGGRGTLVAYTLKEVEELLQAQANKTYDMMHDEVAEAKNEEYENALRKEGADELKEQIISKLGLG